MMSGLRMGQSWVSPACPVPVNFRIVGSLMQLLARLAGRAWVETVVAYALNLFIVITLLLTRITGKLRMVPGDEGYEPIWS